ncbi:uncharacterized protein LOC134658986 [Cydia amplana]|uniref:uncharacterized protein LOC134658986 n=1 Tax=Cydia amplana TaxID=1869771 RepID=UPI002FE6BC64
MKETYLAIGFVSVLSLFALFCVIKFATSVSDQDKTYETYAEIAEIVELKLPVLANVDVWSDMKRFSIASFRYPYLVAIIARSNVPHNTQGWSFICFGSFITMRWIVTAAHCKIPDNSAHRVFLYRDYIHNHTNTYPILRWKVHPGYIPNSTVPWHDIALAEVDKDMETAAPAFFTHGVQQLWPRSTRTWRQLRLPSLPMEFSRYTNRLPPRPHQHPSCGGRCNLGIPNSTVPWHDIALAEVDKDMETAAPVFFTHGVQQVQASVWKTVITMDRRTYLTNNMEIYDVELVDPILCFERYGFTLDDTLICVNMTHNADCFITEFGPIFTPTERVLGVLRLMPNDCDNNLAIFTNVTSYFEWISKETSAGKDRVV